MSTMRRGLRYKGRYSGTVRKSLAMFNPPTYVAATASKSEVKAHNAATNVLGAPVMDTVAFPVTSAFLISGLQQGTSSGQRIGRRVTLQGINLWVSLRLLGSSATSSVPCRIFVIKVRHPAGVDPTQNVFYSNIFTSQYTALGGPIHNNPRVRNVQANYEVIYEKLIDMQTHGATTSQDDLRQVDIKVPCKGVQPVYASSSSGFADAATNQIYGLIVCQNPVANSLYFYANWEILFTDD